MYLIYSQQQTEFYQLVYSGIIILSVLPLFFTIAIDFYRREKRVPLFISLLGGLGMFVAFSGYGVFIQLVLFIILINTAPLGAVIVALSFFLFCVFLFIKGTFFYYSRVY